MLEFTSVREMKAHYREVQSRTRNYVPPKKAQCAVIEIVAPTTPLKPVWWSPQVTEIYQPSNEPKFPEPPTMGEVVRTVANYYRMSLVDILSERRAKPLVLARQVAMYLCSTLTFSSLPRIGRRIDRDHTTVLHGIRKIKENLKTDELLAYQVATIEEILAR